MGDLTIGHSKPSIIHDPFGVVPSERNPVRTKAVFTASYAERCISYSKSVRLSVCLSVCHTLALSQNDSSYDMGSSLEDSPMTLVSSTLDFTAKFQREHGERGRRMREGQEK